MWLIYAFFTILSYVGLDFFIKKAAGKIDDFLGVVVLGIFSTIPAFLIWLWMRMTHHEILVTRLGFWASAIAGASIGIGMITFIKMFATGTNLSLGSPLVRIGTVILATLVGIFVLRESLNFRQILGLIFSVIGLALVVFK